MLVSHCQLSLPFSSIQRLVESQQYKLLVCQCRRIEVNEWEIAALQDICIKKGWITKGVAIVHKYAGCIDEIQQCFSRLNQSIDHIRECHRINNGDSNALLEEVLMISVVFLRLYFTICQWRKLQWTPRPIIVEEDGNVYSVSEYVAMKLNQIASCLIELADSHLKVLRKVPVELLTMLLSPIQMYEGIGELHNRLSTGGTSLSSTLAGNVGNSPSSFLQDIAKMVMDIFNMEDLIDEKWKEFQSIKDNMTGTSNDTSGSISNEQQLLATLCIPYPELKNSSLSMKWFISSFASYDRSLKLLRSIIQQIIDSYPRIKVSGILSDGLISLIDEKKSTMRWSCYAQQSLSITNQLVLQSLIPVIFKSPTVTGNFFPTNQAEDADKIASSSVNKRILSFPPTNIGLHPLSPVHSVSKDSIASTAIECEPTRMKIPPHLSTTIQKSIIQKTLPNSARLEDGDDVPQELLTGCLTGNDLKNTNTNTGPEVISDEGEEAEQVSSTYFGSSSSPGHTSVLTLTPLITPASRLSHDNSFNLFQPLSMTSPPPVFVRRADSGTRIRGFSADASNSKNSNNNNSSALNWKRKRMLSDPLANLDGKKVSFTRQSSDSSTLSGTRSRTWSARGKLMGVDFSATLLSTALRLIDNEDETLEDRAARKIAVWYMMVAPRKKLLSRLTSRDCAHEVINLILDKTHQMVQVRFRRRKTLMRQGAAMKIQRAFRYWVANVLEEERKIEREEKRRMAQQRLAMVTKTVRNGIRIYRYLRYAIRKRMIKRDITAKNHGKPMYALGKIIDMYGQLYSLHKRLEMQRHLQERLAVDKTGVSNDRRMQTFRAMERSVMLIQKLVRGFIARKRLLQAKAMNDRQRTVTLFVAKCLGIRRRKRQERLDKAAKVIQKFMRGYLARRKLFRVVNAGLKLNMLWRKYTAYRSLKGQLRRVEKPHTIIIHGIRNILPKMFVTGQVRVKVLVWWNPLLHIVGHNDYVNFLQSKQPQYIFTSEFHKVISEEVDDNENKDKIQEDQHSFNLRNSFSIEALTRLGSRLGFGAGSSDNDRRRSEQNILRGNESPSSDRKNSLSFGWGGGGSGTTSSSPDRKRSLGGLFGGGAQTSSPTTSNKSLEGISPATSAVAQVNGQASSINPHPSPSGNAQVPLLSNSFVKKPLPPPSFRAVGARANVTVLSAVKEGNERDSRPNSVLSTQSSTNDKKQTTQENVSSLALPRANSKNSIISPAAILAASRNGKNSSSNKPRSDTGRPSKSLKHVSALRNKNIGKSKFEEVDDNGDDDEEGDEDDEDEDDDDDEDGEEELCDDKPMELGSSMSFKRNLMLPTISATSKKETTEQAVPLAPSPSRSRLTLRQTLTFALKLGQLAKQKEEEPVAPKKIRISANFEDETIKIPGCHGNGVFRFEVYDGERKVGYSNFFLNQRGELMFWGGEYQEAITVTSQKRAVQINAQVLKRNDQERVSEDGPKVDFRVVAGAPLRSRCQWGRVVARGKGPFKRILQGRDMMSTLTIFDSWHRFFFSLDEFGLHLFENKFNCQPFYKIPVTDFKSVTIDLGAPIRTGSSSAKNIVEDINNVILKTHIGDELYIRFPDAASRIAWFEVMQNAIDYQSQSHNPSGSKRNWFGSTFFEKKSSIYTRTIKTTFENSQPLAPSAIAGGKYSSQATAYSPLKSKYLSHFLTLKNKDDNDSDIDEDEEEDDDEMDEGEGKNLKKVLYDNSIGLIANSTASLFNSKPAASVVSTPPPVVPPPPRNVNSPITITSKARTPPIFSVPFKGTNHTES